MPSRNPLSPQPRDRIQARVVGTNFFQNSRSTPDVIPQVFGPYKHDIKRIYRVPQEVVELRPCQHISSSVSRLQVWVPITLNMHLQAPAVASMTSPSSFKTVSKSLKSHPPHDYEDDADTNGRRRVLVTFNQPAFIFAANIIEATP